MAQNVTVAGASYSAVPSVDLPLTSGGTASFYDVSDTTATASDVASGSYFYASDGTYTVGTASGGSSTVATASATASSTTATSLSFSVAGEPIAFALIAGSNKSLSSGYYWITSITWDGSTYRSACVYYKSGGGGSRYIYSYSGYASSSYSNGTLTVTTGGSYNSAGGAFTNISYQLIYIY